MQCNQLWTDKINEINNLYKNPTVWRGKPILAHFWANILEIPRRHRPLPMVFTISNILCILNPLISLRYFEPVYTPLNPPSLRKTSSVYVSPWYHYVFYILCIMILLWFFPSSLHFYYLICKFLSLFPLTPTAWQPCPNLLGSPNLSPNPHRDGSNVSQNRETHMTSINPCCSAT